MVLSQLFRSPFVRFPFLGFAVVATVATSQPDAWSLHDATTTERLELPPGAVAQRTIAYEASEASVELLVDLAGFTTDQGKVHVATDQCGLDATYAQLQPKRWYPLDADGRPGSTWYPTPRATAYCQGKEATITVRVENVGNRPIACDLTFETVITGPGGDTEAPKDAFLRLRSVP